MSLSKPSRFPRKGPGIQVDQVFTGLIEEKGTVLNMNPSGENVRLEIQTRLVCQDARIGDSISINGCCLTIVAVQDDILSFEAVPETLDRTNLGQLAPESKVNLERALKPDTRLGGHYVTGHIDGPGVIERIEDHTDWRKIHVRVDSSMSVQMASRGSVAIDGISLTLVDVDTHSFSVVLIPHTLQATTIGERKTSDRVNIETDLLAKYVERQIQFLNPTQ